MTMWSAFRSFGRQAARRVTHSARRVRSPFMGTAARTFSSSASKVSAKSVFSKQGVLALSAGVATGLLAQSILSLDEVKACGIVAFVGDRPATTFLLEGVNILLSRGYDSVGIATINDSDEINVTKYASRGTTSDCVDLVTKDSEKNHGEDKIGIAHTRWATHGPRTDENAHPHCDQHNRLALVHNGTIENSQQLKEELIGKGFTFKSETDTEVIVQLISSYVDEGLSTLDAVNSAVARLQGTWGLVILSKDKPNQLIAARNGSPLVIGIGQGQMFIASEVSAFSRYCKEYVAMRDGEVAVISKDNLSLDYSRKEETPQSEIVLTPAPYPHWTIKEIMEQPEAVSRTLGYGGRFTNEGDPKLGGLDNKKDILSTIRHLVMGASGTSYYASLYGAAIMRQLHSFDTVQPFDASEMNAECLPQEGSGILVVSQSGETKDVHRALQLAQDRGSPMMSVVNTVGSLIARTTKCGVYLYAGRENAVASTKAFTTQVTALALVAVWFSKLRGNNPQQRLEILDAVHRLPVSIGMALHTRDACKRIAEQLYKKHDIFILGKGFGYPIALEGALKIKEITYMHAEGYGGGALKHGPFALLDQGVPVVHIILDDQHAELMRIAAEQTKSRGAYNIVITDKRSLADHVADEVITIPSNGPLTALLAAIPLQLLAYEISILRGLDPDKPKNLAKAVTVD